MEQGGYIEVGGRQYLRSRVTARLKLADASAMPASVAKAADEVEQQFHWIDKKNPDLVHVQFILDTEGANANWDYQTRANLITSHSTAVFKPIDMEHIITEQASMAYMSKDSPPVKNTICGVMTATGVCWAKTGELLTDKEIMKLDKGDDWTREDDDKIAVCAWGALYSFLFPKTVADVLDTIEAGTMRVSMERWIGKWDFMVWDGKTYQGVSHAEAEEDGTAHRWKMHQVINNKPVYRRSLSSLYGGVANTTNPANSLSKFLSGSSEFMKVAASHADGRTVGVLLRLHDALHQQFDTAAANEKPTLIKYHRDITRALIRIAEARP